MLVPWRQRPQAPVVGLTLDKSGVRQNGQTLISRIKFVGALGRVYPLSVAQVLARTVRQLVHIPVHGVLAGWAFQKKALVCRLGWCWGYSYPMLVSVSGQDAAAECGVGVRWAVAPMSQV